MIVKPNWDIFKAKFSENPQENFEWFCYLLFSKEYNHPYGTHRYKNQSGIETDPIEVGSEIIGWQSKFYEDSLSNHKDDLLSTLIKSKRDYPNITKIILYTNSEWGQGQGGNDPKAKSETEDKANELGIKLVWRVKSYFESPFVCIENSIIPKYFFTQSGFIPSFKFISKKMKESIQSVGKRYAPNNDKYQSLNQIVSIMDIFNFINDAFVMRYINDKGKDALLPKQFKAKKDILKYIKMLTIEIPKEIAKTSKSIQNLKEYLDTVEKHRYDVEPIYGELGGIDSQEELNIGYYKINELNKTVRSQESILGSLKNKKILFYKKKILLVSGEALIGKTHLFCDLTLNRLNDNKPTLLFFGNQFNKMKSIIGNMVAQLDLVSVNEEEFLEVLNTWGEECNTQTLIMIDAINETKDSKLWQEGIIKFCDQIKSYPNLVLAMSIRDVEKNKIITSQNEEYIRNEIVEIEHKGFEGIELEAVRTFCEALEVEFPKVPIHTYRLFVNPGMLFLYIETIKNSTKKVDTSIINPLTIFKSYIADLERKYYQKYTNEVDEEDEVVSEAIEEFISLGIQKDYLHFYLDYKEVKRKLKPLHNKILEFLISEGVLNKLKREYATKVYFTYQKFENFFIANYLLNEFETHRDKIEDILFSNESNALIEAFFMQIPQKSGKEPFELYPNIMDEYELCSLYFDSLVWREPKYFTKKTFEFIEMIQNEWEGISSKFLDVRLQLSSIPHHPLNILSLHQELLDMTMLQRDYEWSIKIHNLFIEDKIVKRIIHWAWDKKEEFEIEDESLYLYGLTLGWFLTSSNRELRDGTTKALVNLFTDRVDIFHKVVKEFETVNDLYILERLYAAGYGIVLRSSNQNGFREFGKYVFQTVFGHKKVVEHILLRDYARLTLEEIAALTDLNVDMTVVVPPYGSKMPNEYPSYESIEKYSDISRAFSDIVSSMRTEKLMRYGDFGRYTFQASLSVFDYKSFNDFDIQDLSNYAVKIIHDEYVDSFELFDKAEEKMTGISYDRDSHEVERLGKKYQWLAMYKILAKVADNFQVSDGLWGDNHSDYKDTSRLYIRNIDPTTVLREKIKSNKPCWYLIEENAFEDVDLKDNEAWLQSGKNLPSIREIVNPSMGNKYLVLNTFFTKSGSKKSSQYRYLTYTIHSYIVKQEEFGDTISWAKEHNFYQLQIEDDYNNFDEDYLRAYPNNIDDDYKVEFYRDRVRSFINGTTPNKLLKTSASYRNDDSYDNSITSYINITVPTKWLINKMGLRQSLIDGEWINADGEVVFFDPTVNICSEASSEGVLVANKGLLLDWLKNNGYAIVWILIGEKDLRSTDRYKHDEKEFIGYGGISGCAYFKGDKLIENIDVKIERPVGWTDE